MGVAQASALVPGMSRSGSTISVGMLLGLPRESAARFSFLLGIPGIAAAAAKEGLKVLRAGVGAHDAALFAIGMADVGGRRLPDDPVLPSLPDVAFAERVRVVSSGARGSHRRVAAPVSVAREAHRRTPSIDALQLTTKLCSGSGAASSRASSSPCRCSFRSPRFCGCSGSSTASSARCT